MLALPSTYSDVLRSSSADQGFHFCGTQDADYRSIVELRERAARVAQGYRDLGVRPGDRVAIAHVEPEDFVVALFAAVVAGAIPVPVYPPLPLGALDAYRASLAAILRSSCPRLLLTSPGDATRIGPVTDVCGDSVEVVETLPEAPRVLDAFEAQPDDVLFLQYTSGSTGHPKGVRVTHRALLASIASMAHVLGVEKGSERIVSWLPLYHDMGLIAFVLAPVALQLPTWLVPTLEFVKRPLCWLDWMHRAGGTLSAAPSFAYALTAARAANTECRWDFSSWRVAVCGAEPVRADAMRAFASAMAPHRFRATSLTPAYGMAEATLGISFVRPGQPMKTAHLDPARLRGVPADPGLTHEPIEFVSCGQPLPGHELRIVDETGAVVPEGQQGEILFRGPSVCDGYFGDPAATEEAFDGSMLRTGDLGFFQNGQLFVTGRKKDLVIVRGRNIHPHEIEDAAGRIPGVRPGCIAAFSVNGRHAELLVVVLETRGRAEVTEIPRLVKRAIRDAVGVTPDEVVVVERGVLPKTSSGKLQRRMVLERYISNSLNETNRSLAQAADGASP